VLSTWYEARSRRSYRKRSAFTAEVSQTLAAVGAEALFPYTHTQRGVNRRGGNTCNEQSAREQVVRSRAPAHSRSPYATTCSWLSGLLASPI